MANEFFRGFHHPRKSSSIYSCATAGGDAFIEQSDLIKLGFEVKTLKKEGRPSFESSTLLKIYLNGYINGLRSSPRLESECCRIIKLQWLTLGLKPNYHTIADFRKDNPKSLKNVFKLFVSFLKDIDQVSGQVVAIDGTKSRAHNSKRIITIRKRSIDI